MEEELLLVSIEQQSCQHIQEFEKSELILEIKSWLLPPLFPSVELFMCHQVGISF